MERKHRAKKLKPFIKPLKVEIESHKERLSVQEGIIKNQKAEIENLKKSQVLHSENTEKKIQEHFSFFTSVRKEVIVLQKKEKKREVRQNLESIQESFIDALLKGNLEEAKRLESEGALLKEPNSEGIYPLAAAVYGMNLNAVKHIENNLKGEEKLGQWLKVDAEKALGKIEKTIPRILEKEATWGMLKNWYIEHAGKGHWCNTYDKECLALEKIYSEWKEVSWDKGREVVGGNNIWTNAYSIDKKSKNGAPESSCT